MTKIAVWTQAKRLLTAGSLAALGTSAVGCAVKAESDFASVQSGLQYGQPYTITNYFNGLCADIAGSHSADGTNVLLWTCKGSDNQKFIFDQVDGNYVQIRSVATGKCLDVWEWSTADGANIAEYTCTGGANQQFLISNVASGGVVRIISRLSGKTLDAAAWGTDPGTNVMQWPITGGDNQKFVLARTDGSSSSSSSTTSTTSSTGSCTPPQASPLIGWAAVSGNGVSTTTGGGNATPTVVSSLSELNSAVGGTTPRVVWVQGTISGNVSVGSNKTIVGVCGGQIHGHIEMSGSVNVIVRNLTITGYGVGNCALDPKYDSSVGCSSGQDAISVQKNAHHIWFDHCDISDGTDGNLDITNAADFVTVSWTKFHYTPRTDNSGSDSTGAAGHRFSNLVGGTDSPSSYDDANSLNVTWHHNWWADNVVERAPRVRFGKNHLFNNVWASAGDNYCVRAGRDASILLQNNVFTGVKNPHEFNNSTDQGTAYITANNNAYSNTSGTAATGGGGTAFTSPPYSYSLDSASSVQSAVQSGAGPH